MSVFITFEGIEGSGKTTQIRLLKDYLVQQGHNVVLTREPGGTEIGDQIRAILLNTENSAMVPDCELLLYAAARAQHVSQVISPALQAKKIVLCDRFADATLAYQGSGRGRSIELITKLHLLATGNLKPDLTILLDHTVERGLQLSRARLSHENKTGSEGRFEQEAVEFHTRVRQGYLDIAKAEPERVKVIRADQAIEEIHREIVGIVKELLCCHCE